MKINFSKRLLSAFLAVLMIVTSIPAFAITASAAENTKYLFAYFTGNSRYGQNVRFAVSDDGYSFTALNNNKPVVKQTKGASSTSAGTARDPYISRDANGNGYWMIATDMDATGIHSSWAGDSCIVVWHSDNLTDWEQVSCIDYRDFAGFGNTIRAWAPQFIWDSAKNQYMIYLAIFFEGWQNCGIYYSYTSDFKSLTVPQKLFSTDKGVPIDADIIENNGTYYMYYKDESSAKVWVATSSSLTGTYTPVADVSSNLSSKAVEGNAMYQIGNSNTYVIMLDEYADGSFSYGTTTDFIHFTKYTGSTATNAALSARHGSVMQITDAEYNALLAYNEWPGTETDKIVYNFNDPQSVSDSGWHYQQYADTNGHSYDVMISNRTGTNGNFNVANGVADLYSSNIFINDGPVNEIVRSEEFTIKFSHRRNGDAVGNYSFTNEGYVIGLANNGTDFLKVTESGQLAVLINGTLQTAQSSVAIKTSEFQNFTISYDGTKTSLYIDGKLAATVNGKMDARNGYVGLGYTDQAANVMANASFKNVAFYNVSDFNTEAYDDVKPAIAAFENIIKSVSASKAYTNMGVAYEAYVNLNKAYDSVYYGGRTDLELSHYVMSLNDAVASMSAVPGFTFKAQGVAHWYAQAATDYSANVLYSSQAMAYSSETTLKNVKLKLAIENKTVLLYDGTDATLPIYTEIKKGGNFAGLFSGILQNSGNFELKRDWYGFTDYNTGVVPSGTAQYFDYTDTSNHTSVTSSTFTNTGTGRMMHNVMHYNSTGDASNYFEKVNKVEVIYHARSSGIGASSGKTTISLTPEIYVINYKPIADKLGNSTLQTNFINICNDITNYKEGGAKAYFDAFDAVINPNSYDYANNTDSVVSSVATVVKNHVSALNALTTSTAYTKDSASYAALRAEMDKYETNINGNYTTQSISQYTDIYRAAQTVMADVIGNGYVRGSKCDSDVTAMQNVLNTEINRQPLFDKLSDKRSNASIFVDGVQKYTLGDYDSYIGKLDAERSVVNDTAYYVKDTVNANYSSLASDNLPYTKTTGNSTAYNDEMAKINSLAISGGVDPGYENFDAAVIVVSQMDENKYTADALAKFKAILNAQKAAVYTDVTDELRAKYSPMLDGVDTVKALTTGVDTSTAAILNAVNEMNGNSSNINKFTAKLTVVDTDNNDAVLVDNQPIDTKAYGEMFSLDVSQYAGSNSSVTWAVALMKDGKQVGYQKVSSYNDSKIERKADHDIEVIARISGGSVSADGYILKVLNGYGNVVDVKYGTGTPSEAALAGTTSSMPFYTFTGWEINPTRVSNVYTATPIFDVAGNVTITTIDNGAETSESYVINNEAMVTTANTDGLYGWAVKNGSKYQVVAYDTTGSFSFSAIASQTYVPIYKVGTSYQVNGETLTKNNLDGYKKPAEVSTIDDQTFINAKLNEKAPFVYVEATDSNADGRTKIFVRVTANCDESKLLAYGIFISNGTKEVMYNSTTKNVAGQFSMSMSTATFNKVVSFGGFATYSYTYSDKGVTSSINTTDKDVHSK